MKRENKNNIKVNVDIDKIIDDFFSKFGDVAKSLEVIELRNFILQAINEMPVEDGINQDFFVSYTVEKMFLTKVRDEVNEGNIDLEIMMIDKYMSTAKFLLKQLKYTGEDLDNIAEQAIINSIEKYDGEKTFKSTILVNIRKIINPESSIDAPKQFKI